MTGPLRRPLELAVNPSLVNILKVAAALEIDAAHLVERMVDTIGDPRDY
jgi:hypothetical protein